MIEFIKNHPYYTITIILIICKILGIIDWSWWIITLPIWWWWLPAAIVGIAVMGFIILSDGIKRFKK